MKRIEPPTIVLGAGIAGLTAGLELARRGAEVVILEKNAHAGGLARTLSLDGFRFDLGGHRFHSNNPQVVRWVQELLGDELQVVERASHIYINGRFVDYPLRMPGALRAFPPGEAARMGLSYLRAALRRSDGEDRSFEDWVVRRFGRRVFEAFFRPYTEKVWGVPCDRISADWAAARIGIPSLWQAFRQSLFPPKTPPATAVSRFYYPKAGFGAIPKAIARAFEQRGGRILTGASVRNIRPEAGGFSLSAETAEGERLTFEAGRVVSTVPLPVLLGAMPEGSGAQEALAANRLDYRGLICVFLTIARPQVSADSWTYFPGQDLVFGRTHEPKNWSREMVPEPDMTSLCAEIYTSPGEPAWQQPDEALASRVAADLQRVGWLGEGDVSDALVVRIPYAYPVYDLEYSEKLKRLRGFLGQWKHLHLVGRTGAFRYMNSDGVIEDVFRLMAELYPDRLPEIAPLEGEEGRWA